MKMIEKLWKMDKIELENFSLRNLACVFNLILKSDQVNIVGDWVERLNFTNMKVLGVVAGITKYHSVSGNVIHRVLSKISEFLER